jgi:hypothetical protein
MTHTINTPVQVSAYYFTGKEMKTFPRAIEYGNRVVDFRSGLRYLVQRGTEAIKLFDMSGEDGLTYRLQQNGENWTLLATKGAF